MAAAVDPGDVARLRSLATITTEVNNLLQAGRVVVKPRTPALGASPPHTRSPYIPRDVPKLVLLPFGRGAAGKFRSGSISISVTRHGKPLKFIAVFMAVWATRKLKHMLRRPTQHEMQLQQNLSERERVAIMALEAERLSLYRATKGEQDPTDYMALIVQPTTRITTFLVAALVVVACKRFRRVLRYPTQHQLEQARQRQDQDKLTALAIAAEKHKFFSGSTVFTDKGNERHLRNYIRQSNRRYKRSRTARETQSLTPRSAPATDKPFHLPQLSARGQSVFTSPEEKHHSHSEGPKSSRASKAVSAAADEQDEEDLLEMGQSVEVPQQHQSSSDTVAKGEPSTCFLICRQPVVAKDFSNLPAYRRHDQEAILQYRRQATQQLSPTFCENTGRFPPEKRFRDFCNTVRIDKLEFNQRVHQELSRVHKMGEASYEHKHELLMQCDVHKPWRLHNGRLQHILAAWFQRRAKVEGTAAMQAWFDAFHSHIQSLCGSHNSSPVMHLLDSLRGDFEEPSLTPERYLQIVEALPIRTLFSEDVQYVLAHIAGAYNCTTKELAAVLKRRNVLFLRSALE